LHAQKFTIELIKPVSNKYARHVNKVFRKDGNAVQCFFNQVCVQARDKSFYGATEDEAISKSLVYWEAFFIKLENDVETMLVKERKQNITQTYGEWGTGPCDMSIECEKKAKRLRIYAEDGKLRYTTDVSLGPEREAHHFKTGKKDSETGNRYIGNILDNPDLPLASDVYKLVAELAFYSRETGAGLAAIVKLMQGSIKQEEPETAKERPEYVG
jgi:hypothetical protein